MTGYGKQILSNVDFKWERRGNKPRVFSLTGSFGREPLAVALMRNQNGPPQVEISTSDGGSLMSFLALYDRMDSGVLNARVQLGAQGRADGDAACAGLLPQERAGDAPTDVAGRASRRR